MERKNFTAGSSGRGGVLEMVSIALPMIMSTACDAIMVFTSRLFLSRIGPEYMNAAIGGGVMNQVLIFFFTGLIGYSTALSAQYYGAGRKNLSPVAAFQAVIISVAAYPVILLLIPAGRYFFLLMNTPASQIAYQNVYFGIITCGTLPAMIRYALGCYFTGIGRTRIVMTATICALAMNVGLGYVLIFGRFGFPEMRIEGAAIASNFKAP